MIRTEVPPEAYIRQEVVKNCTFHPVQVEWFKRTFGIAPLGVNATEAELRRQNTLREVLAQMEQRIQV